MPGWKAMRPLKKAPGLFREKLPVIPEEVMVLKQFSGQRLDMLLSGLRGAGVPRIALKAVLTEHNSDWTFYHLYQELKEEHETMTAGQQP